MWIVLLDHSGSMGEPFRGERRPSELRGRVRVSEAAIKLDAAKESLLEHLEGLPTVEPLTILGFTSTTSTIFQGNTSQLGAARLAFQDVEATNGTDIARALRDAKAVAIESLSSQECVARVLVITDGLSGRAEAEQAAMELLELKGITVIIDVILINPTEEGEAVARVIAIRGTVQLVTSAAQLDHAAAVVVTRRIGFPAGSIFVIAVLVLGIALLYLSGNGENSADAFQTYGAIRCEDGVHISWQIQPEEKLTRFRVETRYASGETTLVAELESRASEVEYEIFDGSLEARTGQRVAYRLVRTFAAGQKLSTPWFDTMVRGGTLD